MPYIPVRHISINLIIAYLFFSFISISTGKSFTPAGNLSIGEDSLAIAYILNNRGLYFLDKQNYDSALVYFQRSLSIKKRTLNIADSTVIETMDNLGFSLKSLHKYQDALQILKNSLEIKNQIYKKGHKSFAQSYSLIGVIYNSIGDYQNAFEFLTKALDLYIEIGDTNYEVIANNNYNLGGVFNKMGKPAKALPEYLKAQTNFNKSKHTTKENLIKLYQDISKTYSSLGQYENASSYLNQCFQLNTYTNKKDSLIYSSNLELNANFQMMKDNYTEAISNLLKCKSIYEKYYNREHETLSRVYLNLAIAYYNESEYREAISYVQKALNSISGFSCDSNYISNPNIDKIPSSDIALEVLLKKADILYNFYSIDSVSINLLTSALEAYMLASKVVNKKYSEIVSESSKMLLGEKINMMCENAIDVAYELYKVSKNPKYLTDLFQLFENNKAVTLLQAINNAKAKKFSGVPDSLIAYESNLKKKIFEKNRLLTLEAENHSEQKIEYEASIKKEIFELNYKLQDLIKEFENKYSNYYKLKYQSDSADPSSVINTSFSNEKDIIEYFIGEYKIYILLIHKKDILVFQIPKPADFNNMVESFRESIIKHDIVTFNNVSFKLYELLFAPVEKSLILKDLIIIPDKNLYYIPFEALIENKNNSSDLNYDQFAYLLKKYRISYSFSYNLFKEISSVQINDPNSILIFAPVDFRKYNLKNLPSSKKEAENIAGIFHQKGFISKSYTYAEASAEKFKNTDFNNYRFLHLATHGFVNKENPEYSGVVLPSDSKSNENGFLYIGEVYSLNLRSDLITLSACETGLGKIVGGEGIIGFSRSFLYAGAKNIIVSLWPVDDEATQKLMVSFYEKLIENNSKSRSLHDAKFDMIRTEQGEIKNFADPFFWSSFVLMGS